MPVSVAEPLLLSVAGQAARPGPAPLRLSLPRRELVQVLARRGAAPRGLGVPLPGPGAAAQDGDITFAWTQPGGWLASAPRAGEGALLARLAPLGAWAALVDQSHGRTTLRLEGGAARQVLAKGCRIDLHPRAFAPGRVAATQLGHLACLLHQTAPDAFEVTVFATLAEEALAWLEGATAEFGCTFA